MMMKKNLDSMVKIILLAALAAALCFAPSCKKSPEETPSEPVQASSPQEPEPQPEIQPAEPVQSEPEASEEETEKPAEEAPKVEVEQPEESASGAKLVPVTIELPKPMFVGTPQDMKVENLEKPLGKPRPPFLAPEGTSNVALNKPVSASDEEPIIGDIEMITDGDKEAADGSYVELGPFVQYVTIDLEKECEIYAIVAWHYHKQPRVYLDTVVQLSNDPDFITDVKTVFNNDIDNSAGLGIGKEMHYVETSEGKLIDCLSQGSPKARYVRLYSNGNTSNDLNHYIEVDVYGKPVE
jgi:hypothetical protein